MLRRVVVLFLALAALVLPFGPARAANAPIADLVTELEERRDNDFTGTLDKVAKKQQKAVTKSLTSLSKPAESIAGVLKNVTAAAKKLVKAFPEEFLAMKATTSLRLLLDAVAAELRTQAEAQYDQLAAAVPGINSSVLHDRAESARAAAREELDLAAAAAAPSEAFAILKRALKFVGKGLGYAAKDPFVETVSASIDGVPFEAQNVTTQYTPANPPSSPVLFVEGNSQRQGRFAQIEMSSGNLDPVTGPGTYTVTGIVRFGADPVTITETYTTNNATLVVTALDTAARRLEATFSFTADNLGSGQPFKMITVTGGMVDTKELRVQ